MSAQDHSDAPSLTSQGGRKHSPGPWKVYRTTDGAKVIGIGDVLGSGVTDPRFGLWSDGEEYDANAALIAAAPELLEALARFVAAADRGAETFRAERGSCLSVARAAIAKAEGRS